MRMIEKTNPMHRIKGSAWGMMTICGQSVTGLRITVIKERITCQACVNELSKEYLYQQDLLRKYRRSQRGNKHVKTTKL